ncbi:MAG TPA: hypothetical protein PKW95_21915 [bacterium]|nr:hypothetical protein [bacterium]
MRDAFATTLLVALFFYCFAVLVSLIVPKKMLWGDPQTRTRLRALKFYGGTWLGLFILLLIVIPKDTQTPKGSNDVKPAQVSVQAEGAPSVSGQEKTPSTPEPIPVATPEPTPEPIPFTKEVLLEIETKVEGKKATVFGRTNLPDGVDLSVSVDDKTPGIFIGQSHATVRNGQFSAGPFGPDAGLPDGIYIAEIVMPVPSVQSDAVREIIGQKGEKLAGKLVSKDSILGEIYLEKQVEFFVGLDRESAKIIQAERNAELKKEASYIYSELNRLVREGRAMDRLRRSEDNLELLRQCGNKMRELKPVAEEIRTRAEALPRKYFSLGVASINITLCVTCSRGLAMDNCQMAAEALSEAKKEMR